MKKIYPIFFKSTVILFFVISLISFVISNKYASKGRQINSIDQEIMDLKNENILLANQLSIAKSMQEIERKSQEAGFVEPDHSSYITILPEIPVALR